LIAAAAPSASAAAHFSSLPEVTIALIPNSPHSAIAIVPIPLVPPCTSTQSPSLAKPRSNRLVQTVKSVSGIAAASTSEKPSSTGSAVAAGASA
jgi:hypothetical protein